MPDRDHAHATETETPETETPRPVPATRYTQRTYASGYLRLAENPLTDADRQRVARLQTINLETIGRRRLDDGPALTAPTVRYTDPARPRDLEQIAAEYTRYCGRPARQLRHRGGTRDPHSAIGADLIPGWRITATNGGVALAVPRLGGALGPRVYFPTGATWIGLELLPALWRAYAPVAAAADDHDERAVRWQIGPGQIRWTAPAWSPNTAEISASAWTDDADAYRWHDTPIELPDLILGHADIWPARGQSWEVGMLQNVIMLKSLDSQVLLAIAGRIAR